MILDFLFRGQADGGAHERIVTADDLARYLRVGGGTSAAGISVTPQRAMQFMAVFACVKILAESVGQLPLHLYQQQGLSKEKASDHPLYELLHNAPNAFQTAQEWREWVIACLALHGNAYCQINRVRGSVRELYPFLPGAVTPKQDPNTGEVTYRIALADGSTETLPMAEVLHIKLFPLDGLLGASPIAHARETIGMGIAAERHGAALFARGATPGGVLESAKPINEKSAERLRKDWDELHAGAANAHRTAVLEDGVQWKTMTMPSKDAQWLESRQFQQTQIFGLYRVPPHLAGDLTRSTFSNIEHSSLDFVVHSLMPYLTRIEQRVQLQLLTAEERKTYFAKFNVSALLRGDMAARGQFYTTMVQNGALSPNEIRELEDRNPREGGDTYLQPANMIVSDGKSPAPAPAPSPDPNPPPDPVPPSGA